MSNGVNGVAVIIDEFGTSLHGSLLGTTRPTIDELSNDTTIKVYSKKVFLTQSVSANSNNTFFLPSVFGDNKAFIFVNGEIFRLGVDYKVDGLKCTWLNGSITLTSNDDIQVFGPGNRYTANSFSYETVNLAQQLTDPDVGFDNKQTILLQANPIDTLLKYPYDGKSIYVFVNGESYYHSIDYTYDDASKKVVWEADPIQPTDKVFIFYYNKYPTTPFKLGEVLSRTLLTATSTNQVSFELLDKPMRNYLQSSQVLHDKKRRSHKQDYKLKGLNMYTILGSDFNNDINSTDKIDISYFTEVFVSNTLDLLQRLYDGGDFTTYTPQETYELTMSPIASNVVLSKSMLFFNGLLLVNKNFDYPVSTISYEDWSYNQLNNKITLKPLNPNSRNAPYAGPVIPTAGDTIEFVTVLDTLSKSNIKVEYGQRSNSDTPYSMTAQQGVINQGKYLLFYNGECLFKDYGSSITGNTVTVTAYSAPPGSLKDDIVLFYFDDTQYADLWKFDSITPNSQIAPNNDITFGFPIADINNCMLFYNGVKVPHDQISSGTGSNQIKLSGTTILANSMLLLVHT